MMLEGEEAFFHMNFYTVCTVECWEPVGAGKGNGITEKKWKIKPTVEVKQ